MSEIVKNKASRAFESMAKSGLLNQNHPELQMMFDRVMRAVRADVPVEVDGVTYSVPRFGDLTLLAREVPFYVVDNPLIKAVFGGLHTACTDGRHVFFDADFLQSLVDLEKETGKLEVLPIILHELSHILYVHFKRLQDAAELVGNEQVAGELTNIAFDIAINSRILTGWSSSDYPWGKEISGALGSDDPGRYSAMVEEQIFSEILAKYRAAQQKAQQQQQGQSQAKQNQQGQQGQQQGSGGDQSQSNTLDDYLERLAQAQAQAAASKGKPNEQDASDPEGDETSGKGVEATGESSTDAGEDKAEGVADPEDGAAESEGDDVSPSKIDIANAIAESTPQKGQANDEQFASDVTDHMISPEEFAERMRKLMHDHPELASLADVLGIPEEGDKAAIAAQREHIEGTVARVIAERKERLKGVPEVALPGKAITESIDNILQVTLEPQMDWRMMLADVIDGAGLEMRKNYDEPGVSYYVDHSIMGLDMPLYSPSHIQSERQDRVLVLLDTSGSVSDEMLADFLSEISAIVDSSYGGGAEVTILCADTTVKGDPVVIDPSDPDALTQFVRSGYGGTSFSQAIAQATEYVEKEFPEDAISCIIYFTDLMDFPPSLDDFDDIPPPVVYVCPEHHKTARFEEAVSDYATVIEIIEGNEVDLEQEVVAPSL